MDGLLATRTVLTIAMLNGHIRRRVEAGDQILIFGSVVVFNKPGWLSFPTRGQVCFEHDE